MNVLVTGAAGFIGSHLTEALLVRGDTVTGLDNLDPYYDVAQKRANVSRLSAFPGFRMVTGDVCDREAMSTLVTEGGFAAIAHLAALAGVRNAILEAGLSRKEVSQVFGALTALIAADMARRGSFTLPGLAKMSVLKKAATKARKGINPFTKEPMVFKAKAARKVVKIRPLKALKDFVK